ncbi:MAG: hypothetical protein A3F31_05090 [Candidatus Levybacteria bacterium RIFCSPHIGHO2_12_FULL_38_12]|nr:MAG: hypothetical protein A2770_00285 [Candidatus Levybacteria bacterium RIFCSPHIGHO2_01_FULL_38_12]OGH21715.1 MAG: hypothetical protein A3D75_00815 [Candidatus Levybacteria bacterium RIFCSPHIGHO2_02_FULL_37_18]OGH22627.1 MAG: hypothetical protein A3F31_05090 [Candidatus Levybacteria bacterium RIFCSPHIGHO2_12_FULL_38_12]OGH33336.1 MAG: hypothetical protein A3A47_03765 [Candidatus Levybacteria bacterium RIFCSPLOWO2_01_FULL_37_20]OGH43725.1 MAG: hypothetical protein A3J14_04315 [Candidatus Lev
MIINFVDLKRQNKMYKKEFIEVIEQVFDNAVFIDGEPLEQFERNFAAFCNKKYAVGLNSGTDALFLTLLSHGIGRGDEVITAPNSYIATAMTVSNVGAEPVFVDVDSKSYNIDPTKIEAAITKRTKAIIPVHLYGQPADMDPIIAIAKKYNLIIIEDCCQAHGAKYKGKKVPAGKTGAFSFYPGKNVGAFGDGGAVVTNNWEIKEKLEYLRNDGSIKKYVHAMFGYKSRLDTLQAAILNVKLKHLDDFTQKRRQHANIYNKLLSSIPQITLPKEMEYAYHVYHIYMIQAQRRDDLGKFLKEKGVKTVIHYPTPIHLQKAYKSMGYKKGDFPISEQLAKSILSLPMFPELTYEEINYICSLIREFYDQ